MKQVLGKGVKTGTKRRKIAKNWQEGTARGAEPPTQRSAMWHGCATWHSCAPRVVVRSCDCLFKPLFGVFARGCLGFSWGDF